VVAIQDALDMIALCLTQTQNFAMTPAPLTAAIMKRLAEYLHAAVSLEMHIVNASQPIASAAPLPFPAHLLATALHVDCRHAQLTRFFHAMLPYSNAWSIFVNCVLRTSANV
jgi:hypothetical protein